MAGKSDLRNLLSLVGEVDLRPIRVEAERELNIAVFSRQETLALTLVENMRQDPGHPEQRTSEPVQVLPLDALPPAGFDLAVLILGKEDWQDETLWKVLRGWREARRNVILLLQDAPAQEKVPMEASKSLRILSGRVDDGAFLSGPFVHTVLYLLAEDYLSLARNYPLFRTAVAKKIINDTCYSNAAYSLSTGLAEIIPVLNIPLNIADTIILTKAQAFMVYRLGLALGFSTRWQNYIAEFGSVIGSGFLWRQMARMLVGLIPVFGILPKVAVAYSGTYTIGQAIYQWYLTGRVVPKSKLGAMYRAALEQGRSVARSLFRKRLRIGPSRSQTKGSLASGRLRACSYCGKMNYTDARFCQYCGSPFEILLETPDTDETHQSQ